MRPRLSFVRRPTVWVGARDLVWLGDASRLQAAVRAAKLRRQRADRAIPDRHWLARRSSRSLAVPVRPARRPIRDTHRKPASRAGPVGGQACRPKDALSIFYVAWRVRSRPAHWTSASIAAYGSRCRPQPAGPGIQPDSRTSNRESLNRSSK